MDVPAQKHPIYFPPPPLSASLPRSDQQSKKSKPNNLKLNFSKPRQASSTSTSSDGPKSILKHHPTSTKRPRQYILLFLLVLSFTILILSMIFAYCAALPHSEKSAVNSHVDPAVSSAASILAGPSIPTSTDSSTSTVAATNFPASTTGAISAPITVPISARDTPAYTDSEASTTASDQEVADALARDETNRLRFSTRSAMASLTFYTALLPLLTLLHTSAELLISLVRPETSQHQKSRLGDVLKLRRRDNHHDAEARSVLVRRRIGVLLSFTVSTALLLGWLIMQLFWINCEVAGFGGKSSEKVCPVQIRGHRMGGVSELSVGKVGLAFCVIFGYAAYCAYLYLRVGVFGKRGGVVSLRRRARFAGRGVEVERERNGSELEEVVIAIELDKETR